ALRGTITADATGHATVLAQYTLAPFALALQDVSGIYPIRGFVAARFVVDLDGLCATDSRVGARQGPRTDTVLACRVGRVGAALCCARRTRRACRAEP